MIQIDLSLTLNYLKRKSSKLLFSCGASPFKTNLAIEGSIYVEEAIELGVPKSSLLTIKNVYNIAHEPREIKQLINKITINYNNLV